jgi:hypothetical protein
MRNVENVDGVYYHLQAAPTEEYGFTVFTIGPVGGPYLDPWTPKR